MDVRVLAISIRAIALEAATDEEFKPEVELASERDQKISTAFPTLTSSLILAASQFAVLMHPWLAARPIVSGLLVPWTPTCGLFNPIHSTPTGLFGPGGRL